MSRISTAWEWLRAWVPDHRVQFALCLRVTVAAILTLGLSQLLHLPLVLWTVLTAVIVTQMSVGRSLKATIDYLIGTIGGAIYSGAVAVLVPHTTEIGLLVALALAIAPLVFVAAINVSFSVGPFTAILVLLAPTIIPVSPIESAFYRVIEVALGAVIGLGVSYLVFPARARRLAIDAAARMLDLVARVLSDLIAGLTRASDPQANLRIQDSIGKALANLEPIAGEARRERMPYLAAAPDLGPLVRTLLRLRHDLVMIGRAAEAPLPEAFRMRLAPLLARVSEAVGDCLRETAATLRGRRAPPSLDAVDSALDGYAVEWAAVRREGLTRDLPTDEVERIFVLGFALEYLRQHLKDLRRCVQECAQFERGIARKPVDPIGTTQHTVAERDG
jgi:uncharacterized membrane protein YccC